jgi:hypothetical protein
MSSDGSEGGANSSSSSSQQQPSQQQPSQAEPVVDLRPAGAAGLLLCSDHTY